MIDIAVLRASGLTDDQIFKVLETEQLEHKARVRELTRKRVQNHRLGNGVTRYTVTEKPKPEQNQTPCNANDRDIAPLSFLLTSSSKPSLVATSSELQESKKVLVEGRRVKKRLAPLPVDWNPPERAIRLARELGVSVAPVEGTFRDYLKSSGKQYADYDAAFCNFIRNTPKFKPNGGKSHGRQTLGDRARDLADQIRQREFDAGFARPVDVKRSG